MVSRYFPLIRRGRTLSDMLILSGSFLRPTLHLVAHPVNLLDVREDHFRIDPVVPDHGVHVVGSEEVGDAGVAPMYMI